MPSAASVLAAREGGEAHPNEDTVRLITLEINSVNMSEPLCIVGNSVKTFIAEGKEFLPYFFTEKLPNSKPGIRPEMTISFVQVSEEQEKALVETSSVYPWPTVKRSTWEVTKTGDMTKTSEFLYPMPVRRAVLGSSGVIDVVCSEEDLDDVPLNPVVYTTEDHPGLRAYIG